jgi:hypothetical protein
MMLIDSLVRVRKRELHQMLTSNESFTDMLLQVHFKPKNLTAHLPFCRTLIVAFFQILWGNAPALLLDGTSAISRNVSAIYCAPSNCAFLCYRINFIVVWLIITVAFIAITTILNVPEGHRSVIVIVTGDVVDVFI